VRQYARDRLEDTGGSTAVRLRHRDYYLALAEEAGPKLRGAEQAEWLRRLEEEHENLRAGLEWSLEEAGSKGGLRLCGALGRFWWTRGHFTEGRQWCTRILGKAGAEERTRERACVLNAAGVLSYHQGDYPAARALQEESLAICRELGDRFGIASSLNSLGNVAFNHGDHPAARALLEESLAIRRELGDRFGIASSLNSLGNVAFNQGDHPAARALLEESLAIRRELGDRFGIPYSLEGLAAVVASLGDSLRAARIWGATERSRAEIGTPLQQWDRSGYDRRVAAARIASGDDAAFDSAWQEGRGLTLDQAIDLALAKPVEGG
jgi:non-specific serine/threonine protein kinase